MDRNRFQSRNSAAMFRPCRSLIPSPPRAARPRPQRLDPRRGQRPVRAAVPRADVRGPAHPRACISIRARCRSRRCSRSRPAAVPEDCAYCPQSAQIRHRRQGREADAARRRAGRGAGRESRRREPFLHGRGLARAEGPRRRERLRHGRGRQGAGAGDLRDARHARRKRRRSG